MVSRLKSSLFSLRIKRSNVGLFYLVVIALSAAVAGNFFRKDGGILLLPVVLVITAILFILFTRKEGARGLPR